MSTHIIPSSFDSKPKKPWFRKPLTWVIAGVVVVGGGIGAASSGGEDAQAPVVAAEPDVTASEVEEPVEEVIEEEPVVTVEEPDIEELGLMVLRDMYPFYALVDDESIIEAARASCDLFDEGGTLEMFILIALDEGIDPEEAGALVGFATSAYCPEHAGIGG